MYLQIAVQTGVLSLIALLTFYGIYFITSIKLYVKQKFDTFLSQAGVGIFLGTVITSYSIHYTKLYEQYQQLVSSQLMQLVQQLL